MSPTKDEALRLLDFAEHHWWQLIENETIEDRNHITVALDCLIKAMRELAEQLE